MMNGLGSNAWVNDYVGIPYTQGGRGHTGVDCWGLIALVMYEQRGIDIPDFLGPEPLDDSVEVEELDAPEDFCLVRSETDGYADHWGVYIAGSVLHASEHGSIVVALSHYQRRYPDTRFYEVFHVA